MKFLAVSLVVLLAVYAQSKRYDGYQVLRITPTTTVQFEQLKSINTRFNEELDLWMQGPVNKPTDVMVPPQLVAKVTSFLQSNGMQYTLNIDNVQDLIDAETAAINSHVKPTDLASFDYFVYHSYSEIMQWMTDFVSAHPVTSSLQLTEFELPSRSYEGRQIKVMKLSTGSGRRGAYTQGGIHAREWISPATIINLLRLTVEAYDNGDSVITNFLNTYDWYVIPSLNVDGYVYSGTSDRMWRKNREPTYLSFCVGTDLNRNYGYEWSSSGSPCGETYPGTAPYSAPELQAVTDWLLNLGQQFDIHVDVHSYSQYWVYPYSYTTSSTRTVPNLAQLENIAAEATAALKVPYNTRYTISTSGDWYVARGASEDFGYEVLLADFSYTVELRDTGRYGFILPEDQIEPTGIETFEGFKEFFYQVLIAI